MVWDPKGTQGNEAQKVKWEIVPYTRGRVLDLGCGPWKTFPHFTGVDNLSSAEMFGWRDEDKKADIVVDTCEKMDIFATQGWDAVFSSHLLEHMENPEGALKEWFRIVKPGGYLVLYLPHKNFYPNIGEKGSNPDHKSDFLPEDIVKMMEKIGGWDLLRNEDRNERDEYSFFQVYRRRNDRKCVDLTKEPKPEKTCAIVRYGAIGDMIMASSIFPGLKEQGYHITLFTTERGMDVVKNDPHIDEFSIQDRNQIPNNELHSWWAHLAHKYTKLINLSESVEGQWLAVPGRREHQWPHEVRHQYLNKNYMEFTHDLAGVPLPPRSRFYATQEEKQWATRQRKKAGTRAILWSLSGSAYHKAWPHTDLVIARFLYAYKDLTVVLVGDKFCTMLEAGWQKEERVWKRSGVWSIRETLAFAETVDLILGSETGVLNACSMLPIPKICMLSHSSHENLCKHWYNTVSLEPELTPCYPCHQMHYGKEFCHSDKETNSALCQFNITVPMVWNEITGILGETDVHCPDEYVPTISIHDNKAFLKDNIGDALGVPYG